MKVCGTEWSREELWAQGLEGRARAAAEQMGESGGERKWLSDWVVVSGRRNAGGRQRSKKDLVWFHFCYSHSYSKMVAVIVAGLAVRGPDHSLVSCSG